MTEKWNALIKNGNSTYLFLAVAVIACAGLLLWPEKDKQETVFSQSSAIQDQQNAETVLESRIAEMVAAITGENAPHVTVTLHSNGETVYATEDRQRERNEQEYDGADLNRTQTDGDTEKTYIIVKASDGSQQPLIVTKTEPTVQGVVVVSQYGNDVLMREKITQAVKTALNLSSTQVCVTGCSEYTYTNQERRNDI